MEISPKPIELFRELKRKIGAPPRMNELLVQPYDVVGLMGLSSADFIAEKFDKEIAKAVALALSNRDLDPLSKAIGVKLIESKTGERLIKPNGTERKS